jgi:hypothetical protein
MLLGSERTWAKPRDRRGGAGAHQAHEDWNRACNEWNGERACAKATDTVRCCTLCAATVAISITDPAANFWSSGDEPGPIRRTRIGIAPAEWAVGSSNRHNSAAAETYCWAVSVRGLSPGIGVAGRGPSGAPGLESRAAKWAVSRRVPRQETLCVGCTLCAATVTVAISMTDPAANFWSSGDDVGPIRRTRTGIAPAMNGAVSRRVPRQGTACVGPHLCAATVLVGVAMTDPAANFLSSGDDPGPMRRTRTGIAPAITAAVSRGSTPKTTKCDRHD